MPSNSKRGVFNDQAGFTWWHSFQTPRENLRRSWDCLFIPFSALDQPELGFGFATKRTTCFKLLASSTGGAATVSYSTHTSEVEQQREARERQTLTSLLLCHFQWHAHLRWVVMPWPRTGYPCGLWHRHMLRRPQDGQEDARASHDHHLQYRDPQRPHTRTQQRAWGN